MHDNSVSSGDTYIKNFLVGTGTITNPAAGSLFASSLFQPGHRTLFVLWWDENSQPPELFYGSSVEKGYVSNNPAYDHYALLRLIENNWGLSTLTTNDGSATPMTEFFSSGTPSPLSASFTYVPSTPLENTAISFTGAAVGGTAPYTCSWSFGDGGSATGLVATHSYTTTGTYTPTLTVTDSAGGSAKSSQTIRVVTMPALTASFTFVPTQPLSSQAVAFTGMATGGVSPYSYSWNFGDGNSEVGQTSSHTYGASSTFTVSLDVTDSLKTSVMTSQFITVSSQPQLTASFTISPAILTINSTVTLTGAAVNGISPYSFAWNFGDNSKASGATVIHTYRVVGAFIVSLNVTDNTGFMARTSQSITVLQTSSGGGGGGPRPLVIGWGGISLNEVSRFASGNPPSQAFPGQQASDMESVVILAEAKGMNGIRVSWDPTCTISPSLIDANYTATQLSTAIQIAGFYHFWIILDYHGYTDPFTAATSACWLSFWAGVTNQFKNSYSQIIWEPENEPKYGFTGSACSGATACVPYLSNEYQMFINQTRAQGDTHWIIVENICSFGCGLDANGDGSLLGAVNGYPTVADPAGHIFISMHSYLNNPASWTYSDADAYAQGYYDTVLAGISKTGRPALNTEGGASPYQGSGGPTDILTGSAGYNNITLRFIQTLTNLYDSAPARIGYAWWTAGDWTNTPGAGSLGAMQCNSTPKGWGCLLQNKPVVEIPPPPVFDYSLSDAGSISVQQGSAGTITINAKLTSGTAQSLTMSCVATSLPAGSSCSFSPTSVTTTGSSLLTIFTTSTTPAGTFRVQVTATPLGASTVPITFNMTVIPPTLSKFTLTFHGYDYDGPNEETIKLNNNLLARLPTSASSQNGGVYRTFTLNITSLIVPGNNTLTFTHANWDCGTVDSTKNVTITDATGAVMFSDPVVRPLSCTQSITYTFTINTLSPALAATSTDHTLTVAAAVSQPLSSSPISGRTFRLLTVQ
jgi:PKD repeat protein